MKNWEEAEKEWLALSQHYPEDDFLKLELATFLERRGDWTVALLVYDDIIATAKARDVAERAYDGRKILRAKRSDYAGLAHMENRTGDNKTDNWAPFFRHGVLPRLMVGVDWNLHRFRDPTNLFSPSFVGSVEEYGVEAEAILTPQWNFVFRGHRYSQEFKPEINLGGSTEYRFQSGAVLELDGEVDRMWKENVDAIIHRGMYDRATLTWFQPFAGKWSYSLKSEMKRYRIFLTTPLGRERRGTVSLSREIFRSPYGSKMPIRSMSLSGSWDRAVAEQNQNLRSLLSLQRGVSAFTLNLTSHVAIGRRGGVDLTAFLGHDSVRQLRIQRFALWGGDARFHFDVTPRFSVNGEAQYATESSEQQGSGKFRQAKGWMTYYY